MNVHVLRASLAACILSAVAVAGGLPSAPSVPPNPSGGQGPTGLDGAGPVMGNDGVGGIERSPFLRDPKQPDDGPKTDGKPIVTQNPLNDEAYWQNLGEALTGTHGNPRLDGTGDVEPGNTVVLRTENARPASPATLVIGFGQAMAAYKGGTMVPTPDLKLTGLQTNDAGIMELPLTLPADMPAGLTVYLQTWIVDPAATAGASATNGLAMTSGS